MSLKKPIAVIVGVGPGLGAAVARRFAVGGYSVGLISRKEENLLPIQKQLEQNGHTAAIAAADTGNPASLINGIQTLRQKLGDDPEVLVYNATGFLYSGILDIKPEALQDALNSTAIGCLVASQQVLPAMVKNGKGTILVTGATASLRGSSQFAVFAASKFALRALTQSIAREFSPKGVHVAHFVIDGGISTPERAEKQEPSQRDSLMNSDAIAETYWQIHSQHRSTWTHELDLRPYVEDF